MNRLPFGLDIEFILKIKNFKLMICGGAVLAGSLSGCNLMQQPSVNTAPQAESLSLADPNADIKKKILGQWKIEGSDQVVGFTDTGILYAVNSINGKYTPVEIGPYVLDSTQSPMQIQLEVGGKKVVTMIEFLNSGEMRSPFTRIDLDKPLLSRIPETADRLKKISDVSSVPDGMMSKIVARVIRRNKELQRDAKTMVSSMNRASQAFLLENGRFPTRVSQLGFGANYESAYRYTVKNTGESSVQTLGSPKLPELKGYIGGVFLITSSTGERVTAIIICEESQSGTEVLPAPTLINNVPTCSADTVEVK
jgi:hypothetical protein